MVKDWQQTGSKIMLAIQGLLTQTRLQNLQHPVTGNLILLTLISAQLKLQICQTYIHWKVEKAQNNKESSIKS